MNRKLRSPTRTRGLPMESRPRRLAHWRGVIAAACVGSAACLCCCGRTPDSKPIAVPKSSGNRESVYGKAMDSADRLNEKVQDYNKSIEQTIEQGTDDKPPERKPTPPGTPPGTPASPPPGKPPPD